MTTYSLAPPRSLVGADLLKLGTRRGLAAVAALLTVGAIALTFGFMAVMHATSPRTHGPAGGVVNFGHGAWIASALGAVVATIVAATAGAQDLEAGVYRDLVATGRSRLRLFAARIPAGLLFVVPFAIAAYALAAVAATGLAGGDPTPSTQVFVETGLWVLLQVVFYYLLALGLACLVGSRSYAIGIALVWRLALTPLLASATSLGSARELIPGVGLQDLAPKALGYAIRQGRDVPMSTGAIAAVLVAWALAAIAAGAWRDTKRDA